MIAKKISGWRINIPIIKLQRREPKVRFHKKMGIALVTSEPRALP